jgi:hypothetical protein
LFGLALRHRLATRTIDGVNTQNSAHENIRRVHRIQRGRCITDGSCQGGERQKD